MAADQKKEQIKLDEVVKRRREESSEQREKRVADYRKDRHRDHRMIEELTKTYLFKLVGEATVKSHQVYVLNATPRPGYRPYDKETEVLTGMRGKLWIDKATFQWVKVQAEVTRPVSIEGFLARVRPGTDSSWREFRYPAISGSLRVLPCIRRPRFYLSSAITTMRARLYFNYQKADDSADTLPAAASR